MADKKKKGSETDVLYEWLKNDLLLVKRDLMSELKLSSAQIAALYGSMKGDKDASSSAIAQEIRYSYKQNQNIYDGLSTLVKTEVAQRLNSMDEKMSALEQIQAILNEISELKYNYLQLQAIYESLSSVISGEVVPKLDNIVGKDEINGIVENSVSVHSQQILDALAAMPKAEDVDYARITEEVGDKLLELLNDLKENEEPPAEIDYDRIAGDTAAKVIESMPYPEQFDYNRIEETVSANAVDYARIDESIAANAIDYAHIDESIAANAIDYAHIDESIAANAVDYAHIDESIAANAVDYARINESIANAVAAAVNVEAIAGAVAAALDIEAIANAVAAKIAPPAIDYEQLAEIVVDKLSERGISADVILDDEGITKIADTVADKVGAVENIDYDKVCLAAQAAQILPDPIDYDRVAEIVEDKLAKSNEVIEKTVVLDEEGIEKIVGGVAEELRNMTLVCEYEELPQEEAPVEERVEEVTEMPVVEETLVEEPVVEETPVAEELAASEELHFEEDSEGQLIDADTGLVVRLKRSFTAKMKQSEEQVKVYYNDIKNALTSYKKINSNVSWHGDRFNYGRETVAKIGINGKTLCFYLALDPNDPELKQTVYHQKDVGAQKAYENTPFMMKIKSDAALKKALRLVGVLANKLGAVEDEDFQEVDYVAEYAYASTKRLFEEGDIKATKEKKVDFNF